MSEYVNFASFFETKFIGGGTNNNIYVNFANMYGGGNGKIKIDKSKPALVLFYADWCPHCVQFKPIWNEIKRVTDTSKINMLDTNEETDYQEYNIQSYPTIKYFGGSKEIDYKGPRTVHDIAAFINANVGSDVCKPPI